MPSCCNPSAEAFFVPPTQEDKVSPGHVQAEMSTPRPQARKVKKSCDSKKSANQQTFNGKTYACMSCKNGHRVRLCNHGYKRPISATNQPGRPSSGSKRKCTCPKNCPCSEKDDCKCERNCVCVEAMYLIVHVSKQGSPILSKANSIQREASPILSRVNEEGTEEFLQKVYTDLNGKQLSDAETVRRIEEREKREQNYHSHKQESRSGTPSKPLFKFDNIAYALSPNEDQCSGHTTPLSSTLNASKANCYSSSSASGQFAPVRSPGAHSAAVGGCQHANNASHSRLLHQPVPTHQPSILQHAPAQGCNCGASCQCIHCPEHANNAPTLQYNYQQFAHMANNAYLPSDFQIPGPLFRPEVPQASCMGGPTTFRLSSRPPEPAEYSQMFPDAKPGSYIMQYEVRRNPQSGYQQYVEEMNDTGPYQLPHFPSSQMPIDEMIVDRPSEPLQIDFDSVMDDDFIGWDNVTIGDASVNQIPRVPPSTLVSHTINYSAALTTPGIVASYAQPVPFVRSGNASPNTFSNLTLPGFVSTSEASFGTGPHLPIPNRPNEASDDPFISMDGPFMGHPASPGPNIMSPVIVRLDTF